MKRKQQRRDEITVRMDVTQRDKLLDNLRAMRRHYGCDKYRWERIGRWIDYFAGCVPKGTSELVCIPGDVQTWVLIADLLRRHQLPSYPATSAAVARAMHPAPKQLVADSETMAGARAAAAEMDAGGDDVPMGLEKNAKELNS